MNMSAHLQELQKKHEILSKRVEEVQRSPGSDALEISQLKKQKLQLKEEIHRLSEARYMA